MSHRFSGKFLRFVVSYNRGSTVKVLTLIPDIQIHRPIVILITNQGKSILTVLLWYNYIILRHLLSVKYKACFCLFKFTCQGSIFILKLYMSLINGSDTVMYFKRLCPKSSSFNFVSRKNRGKQQSHCHN